MVTYGCLLPTRGVVFGSDGPADLAARVRADVIGMATRAESLGYGSVWVGDSVLAKPRLEPLATLSAIAASTDSIGIGTAVYLPALRHPATVAHATATVDQISGGRLSLGVGVGVRPPEREEMEQLGVDYERRGAVLNEGLDVISGLWSGGPVTYDGEFYALSGASIGFSPVTRPSIYVASTAVDPERGFPKTIRERLAEHADGWLPIAMSPETYAAGLETVRDLAGEIDPAYYIDVVIADSGEAALAKAREFLLGYYSGQVAYDADEAFSDGTIRERGVFGPPDEVAAALGEYVDAGVERFVVRFTAPDQREQLRAFAEVMDAV